MPLLLLLSFTNSWAKTRTFSDASLNKYREDERFHYQGPEKKKAFEEETLEDGTVIKKYEDGSKETQKPDGTVITTTSDGITIEKRPDGTIIRQKEDGDKITQHPDGTITWEKKDGSTITRKPDGTFEERRTDGEVYEIDPVEFEEPNSFSLNIAGPLAYVLAFGVIALILFFVLKNIRQQGIKDSDLNAPLEDEHEDLESIAFESEIDKYLREKDHRNAIRYYFLQSLKALQDNNHIVWKKDKTNRDYYFEIKDMTLKNEFEIIGFIFEFAWYGNNEITEGQMTFIQNKFTAFNQLMNG